MTPLRKGMFGVGLKLKETLGRRLDGLWQAFGRKSREAEAEISRKARPAPLTEAEEELRAAMGWDDQEGESAVAVAARKAKEALG